MRVALWGPFPTRADDHYGPALPELARRCALTIVTPSGPSEASPGGTDWISDREWRSENFDVNLFLVGSEARPYGFAHAAALDVPGLVLLEDAFLAPFYTDLAGDEESALFLGELELNAAARRETKDAPAAMPTCDADWRGLLLSRRLLETSIALLVPSTWAERTISAVYNTNRVHYVPLPVHKRALVNRQNGSAASVVVIGDAATTSTLEEDLAAVAAALCGAKAATATVLGTLSAEQRRRLESIVAGRVELVISCDELATRRDALAAADLVLVEAARPVAGQGSLLVEVLAAGRVVLASANPQHKEFEGPACRLLPEAGTARSRLIANIVGTLVADAPALRAAGESASATTLEHHGVEHVAARLLDLAEAACERPRLPQVRRAGPPAANAIASWAATNGLSEAARRTAGALLEAGVDIAIEDNDFGAPRDDRRFPTRLRSRPRGRPHRIDLCFVNVNELQLLDDDYLKREGGYIVASWFWELPDVPAHIGKQLRRVDEIWVASSFVAETFARYTSAHIEVFPCVVEPVADEVDRAHFDLPDDRVLFVFSFDANSTFARKNPWGVIEAYRLAFTDDERRNKVHLVIKTINLQEYLEGETLLVEQVEAVHGTLIVSDLSAAEMAGLISLSDVYVSLHRAEGFGLGMAEAMYFGVPVIATAYSGNLDFTEARNSCQVGYSLREITAGELRFNPGVESTYRPGLHWAEPDVAQAARWMRLLAERPEVRASIGSAGQRTVRPRYAVDAVGSSMRRRLEVITEELVSRSSRRTS